jgi:HAD superfamily hydrolase (TIGR01509 family)
MIKAILFDVDGVLIDTLESNARSYSHDFELLGGKPITPEEYKKFYHLPARVMFKRFFPEKSDQEIERIIMTKTERTVRFFKYAKLFPGVMDTLENMKKHFMLGIVTSRMNPKILDYFSIKSLFQEIVCLSDVKNHKPHPEPVHLALERLKTKPEEAVFVGDAQSDLDASRGAGVKVIIYRNSKVKGDFNITDFRDIPKIIERLNGKK